MTTLSFPAWRRSPQRHGYAHRGDHVEAHDRFLPALLVSSSGPAKAALGSGERQVGARLQTEPLPDLVEAPPQAAFGDRQLLADLLVRAAPGGQVQDLLHLAGQPG